MESYDSRLATIPHWRGFCKHFTSLSALDSLEINLNFSVSGKRREQMVDLVFEDFREARGISAASVRGIAPVSKGSELAKLMMTPTQNLDDLLVPASVYDSRGKRRLEAKENDNALCEYLLGQRYAIWAAHYLERMKDMDDDYFVRFVLGSLDSLLETVSALSCGITLCLIKCGRAGEASDFIAQHEKSIVVSEKTKAYFYHGLALLVEGIDILALNSFISALEWRDGVGLPNSEVDT